MKAVVATFNQEKALVGAFTVITNLRMELGVHRGRVVIVTALESDARYQQLVAAVQQQLELVNKETAAAGAGQQLLPLAEVEVSLVQILASHWSGL